MEPGGGPRPVSQHLSDSIHEIALLIPSNFFGKQSFSIASRLA
jgi:hypothetical protein